MRQLLTLALLAMVASSAATQENETVKLFRRGALDGARLMLHCNYANTRPTDFTYKKGETVLMKFKHPAN